MCLSNESKIFLLPRNCYEYEFMNLNICGSIKTLVLSGEEVFEIREIGPSSAFDSRPEPKFPSGEPVKSLIFESEENNVGYVKQSANLLQLSKYDLLFLVLYVFRADIKNESERYKTKEDLLDEIALHMGTCSIHEAIKKKISNSFDLIFDKIVENEENYYRVNKSEVVEVLSKKIESLRRVLLENKNFTFSKIIEESLGGDEVVPSQSILELQTLKYCIDYVFDSYLTSDLKDMYYKSKSVDFSNLDAFMKQREKKQRERAAVEENRASVTRSKPSTSKNEKTKKLNKKKPVKVAIGKGALDSFFGKN